MALPLLSTLGLFLGVQYPSSVSAWVPPHVSIQSQSRLIERPAPSRIGLSSAITLASSEVALSSAYDRAIPASIVGEAVRAALRSDRGVCFDFSTDRYAASGADGRRLVSVVGLRGEGTKAFVNAKFSRSIPVEDGNTAMGGAQLSASTKLVRKGRAFETAYLTSKGRMIDRLLVLAFPEKDGETDDAFLVTSPGNSGPKLYNELSKFVFPMDKVSLNDSTSQSSVITLACSSLGDAQTSFNNNILGLLMKDDSYSNGFEFPSDGVCHHYRVSGDAGSKADVYVMKHTFLSEEICHGYSLLVQESGATPSQTMANQIWDNLTDELNDKGPVGVGALEYDTLRVEAGLPGYGYEMSGDGPKKGKSQTEAADERSGGADDAYYAKSSPLELHLQSLVDTEKGCYQGQEGIASILKNKRGCPRQLYQAVFYDDDNDFNGDGGGLGLVSINNKELMEFNMMKKQAEPIPNDTRPPRPGDNVFVLGSSESIAVGKITSVAEPNGTGDAKTVALALAKRPGPILKAIKEQGLEMPRWWEDADSGDEDDDARGPSNEKGGSGIMQPPPLDPLHNLEIVIGGTYTVGRLVSVPSRRSKVGSGGVATLLDYEKQGTVVDAGEAPAYFKYNFEDDQAVDAERAASSPVIADVEEDEQEEIADDLLAQAEEDAAKAAAEAEKAAAEAKRKEEKMKILKARAEAAMAARRKKKESS
ncbi:hypothetical protein ACHAXT_008283 [Thalassiosira profunda]